jgi:Uma2 family endonuclease
MQTLTIDKSKKWTVDDYLKLDEELCQLINGELIMTPAPNTEHQRTSKSFFRILEANAGNGEVFYSPIDLYCDNENVFQPDLLYISERNKKIISERGIEGAPDLIIEIISPSNSFIDRYTKKTAYFKFGVLEYWIVDPANKTLEIYHDDTDKPYLYLAGEGIVKSKVLKTMSFNLETIFSS